MLLDMCDGFNDNLFQLLSELVIFHGHVSENTTRCRLWMTVCQSLHEEPNRMRSQKYCPQYIFLGKTNSFLTGWRLTSTTILHC